MRRGLRMTDDESYTQWVKTWVSVIESTDAVQRFLHEDPGRVAGIKSYADSLRLAFPSVSDADLGRLLVWIGEFTVRAAEKYGVENATPDRLNFTFAMTARELFRLDVEA
jgi:hypothetical protein